MNYFSRNPRILFLIDGLGAVLTAFSLFIVVSHFSEYFGMPANILTYLSAIGLIYCTYSLSSYFLLKGNWAPYLRIIAIGNFLYCVVTMALLHFYHDELTTIGFAYFLTEILIILLLVYIELRVANMLRTEKTN